MFTSTNEEIRITAAMKEGLARLYADEGVRGYLLMEIQQQNQNAMHELDNSRAESAARFAQRAKAFQDLLDRGKSYFTMIERLKVEKEKELKAPQV